MHPPSAGYAVNHHSRFKDEGSMCSLNVEHSTLNDVHSGGFSDDQETVHQYPL
jgi:hypothetical protein